MKRLSLCLLVACNAQELPQKNYAVIVGRMIDKNSQCESLGEGWGFIPDTAVCKTFDVDKDGVKTPAELWQYQAGPGHDLTGKKLYDFRPKAQK